MSMLSVVFFSRIHHGIGILNKAVHGKPNLFDSMVQTKLTEFISPQIQAFNKLLNIIGRYVRDEYVFIIDSVDHLQPKTLEWIPEIIPQNVKFIFSLEGDSTTAEHLSTRSDTLFLRMSELSGPEKAAAIRCYFAQYGKVLNESGISSQVCVCVCACVHIPAFASHIPKHLFRKTLHWILSIIRPHK
ncbi:unnamed protein product [Dibothriocephalus latus]|uniref:Uncharacterized protein n=1 Tax=Dibothriocephalus latus TaxID=60516 RepID=A0A3P7QZC0_DIBLA|nr:unnamed protein product [Dibothriocephalus latus]